MSKSLEGRCKQCKCLVSGRVGHRMGCSYGRQLFLAEHPEITYGGEYGCQEILKLAEKEGWIIPVGD